MEDIKLRITGEIVLYKKEIFDEIQNADFNDIGRRVFLYKEYDSINLFQELFYIACNKSSNQRGQIINEFTQITKGFVDTCKMHMYVETSSWTIHLKTYEIINRFLQGVYEETK